MVKVNIISEIGINHNGSIELCKEMIKLSKEAGADYVKIQKRNPDVCVPEAQKSKMRDTPWGRMKYIDYKYKVEFNEEQIKELVEYASELGIKLFSSVWDLDSVDVMSKYSNIGKIGSACITDLELCKYAREKFDTLIVSTGMSTEKEIEECVKVCNPDVIMHTNSTYPSDADKLNLNYILWLKEKYPEKKLGYSGHEKELLTTQATVGLGVEWVERHFTTDKTLWGSDQSSSIEPNELKELVNGIRLLEKAFQYKPQERLLFEGEKKKRESLRKK